MAAVSKLDYLKRYMDGDNNGTKKLKKKKKVKKHSNIKIIDNSISFKEEKNISVEDEGEFDLKEEKPIVYAQDGTTVLTEEYNEKERLKKERWKSINSDKVNVNKNNNNNNKNISTQKPLSSHRHDSSDDDLTPVRQTRGRCDTSDSDLSPVRRSGPGADSDRDLSPVRKRRDSCSGDDLSPVRSKKSSDSHRQKTGNSSRKRTELCPEILSTGKSGLRTGAELRDENELKRKREREVMRNLDSDVTGKGADTVHRDKSGRKIDLKLEAIKKRKAEEEKLEQEEKHAKWGHGLAQGENYQKQLQDDLHEMEKPLARHKDDEDLGNLLRQKERAGDPMAAFISNKKKKEENVGKPKYSGPVVANRFNMWPGYRWDGVDRSNGFEKQRFMEISKRKGLKDAAYKWSVEDM